MPFPCKPCRPLDVATGLPYNPVPFALPYVKSVNLFHCPSDNGIKDVPGDPTHGKPVWQVEGTSYCLNTVVTRVKGLGAIPYPADTYMGAEVYSWHWTGGGLLWSSNRGSRRETRTSAMVTRGRCPKSTLPRSARPSLQCSTTWT